MKNEGLEGHMNEMIKRAERDSGMERRSPSSSLEIPFTVYHHQEELTRLLHQVHDLYPDITRVFSVGKSVRDRDLWAIEISDNPGVNEKSEPEFCYIGNMHGDETVGRELLLDLIVYLVQNSDTPRFATLINTTSIYIIPTMNPDGFELGRRGNAANLDLNRNFPDRLYSPTGAMQPETQAIISFSEKHRFVMSANFHGGSVVANYPYDGNVERRSGLYAASPDDEVFKYIALTYAARNPSMRNSGEFPNGITNGAAWYVLYGGMQDWKYVTLSDLELTIELSNVKYPDSSQLPNFWEQNRESMLKYLELVNELGIKGTVTDETTGAPLAAVIKVNDMMPVKTDPQFGDYVKVLVPNKTYQVTASATGYVSQTKAVVTKDHVQILVNFALQKHP